MQPGDGVRESRSPRPEPRIEQRFRLPPASARLRCLLVAAVGTLALATAGLGSARAAVDLAAPERGITDPIARMDALVLDCGDGEVDVNTASRERLAEGLAIDSGPTLDRIEAGRPWLEPTDLISVPGVGPSTAERLRDGACATPLELPMATPMACETGSRAVDLQAATAAEISRRLRLSRPVAERLVDVRPLPQDLAQIVAPRVPGLSRPKVDRLLADGSICVTPAPFHYEGRTWRWASEQHGVVAAAFDDPRYALIVPPRTTAGPTGAWAAIEPLAPDGSLPRADLDIEGAWADEVATRMPDPAPYAGGEPAVKHDTSDGTLAYSWGRSVVSEPAGTIVAAMRSLSVSEGFDRDAVCASNALWTSRGGDDGSLLCAGDSPRDMSLRALLEQRGTAVGTYWASQPEPGPCLDRARLVSTGSLPWGMFCEPSVNGRTATWRIDNSTGVDVLGGVATSYGTVIAREARGNFEFQYGTATADFSVYSLFQAEFARHLAENVGLMLGGTSIEIRKQQGSGPSTFHHGAVLNPLRIAEAWLTLEAFSVLDSVLKIVGVDLPVISGFTCIDEIGAEVDFGSVTSCVEAFTEGYIAIELAKAGSDEARKAKLRSARSALRSISARVAYLPRFGAMVVLQLGTTVGWEDLLTLQYLSPPPTGGGGGLAGDGSFIARSADGAGFLVAGGTAKPIVTGRDFLCYASTRLVIDLVERFDDATGAQFLNLDPVHEISAEPASACDPPTMLRTWDYGPPPAGNTPLSVILRGDEADATVSSWLINAQGEIETIPDGRTYECLARANPVIWNVPYEKVQAWRPVGTRPASCG